jgi:hypothetical protein
MKTGKAVQPLKILILIGVIGSIILSTFLIIWLKNDSTPDESDASIAVSLNSQGTIEIDSKSYVWKEYSNNRYTCAKSGNQTFIIFSPEDLDDTSSSPLIVRFHGGGAGYWKENGDYIRENDEFITQYGYEQFKLYFKESGLMTQLRQAVPSARFLLMSMCDHDYYGGDGSLLDPNNPYSTRANPKKADGLLATTSAFLYIKQHFGTSKVIFYGTSAGAYGAFINFYHLGKTQSINIDGVILDSGLSDWKAWTELHRALGGLGALQSKVQKRMGLYGSDENPATLLLSRGVQQGWIKTPIYLIWSANDQNAGGNKSVNYNDPYTGVAKQGRGTDILYSNFADHLKDLNPGGKSVARKSCITTSNAEWECDRHVPTQVGDLMDSYADNNIFHPDFNADIVAWVKNIVSGSPFPHNKCVDGTPYNECGAVKPKFCSSNGILENNCSKCGCSSGQECQSDGSCKVMTSTGIVCGPMDTNGDNKLTVIDLSNFVKVYSKKCKDNAPTTGCKGKDTNGDKKVTLIDLSNFVKKYGKKSCAN